MPALQVYPTSPTPSAIVEESQEIPVVSWDIDEVITAVRPLHKIALRRWRLRYDKRYLSEMNTIRDFYDARRGRVERFSFTVPGTSYDNLVPNAGLEEYPDLKNWTVETSVAQGTPSQSRVGRGCIRILVENPAVTRRAQTPFLACKVAERYFAATYGKASHSTGGIGAIFVEFFDSVFALITTHFVTANPETFTTSFVRYTSTFTVPTGGVWLRMGCHCTTAATPGRELYFDDFALSASGLVVPARFVEKIFKDTLRKTVGLVHDFEVPIEEAP